MTTAANIKPLTPWRVESRYSLGRGGQTRVFNVVREIEVTQPDGTTYKTTAFLPNGKTSRFSKEDRAAAACKGANEAA